MAHTTKARLRAAVGALLFAATLVAFGPSARAQQQQPQQLAAVSSLKDVPVTDSLSSRGARRENGRAPAAARAAQQQEEEEEFIKPARPGVANPAEIQKAGVLQVEFGYDGLFRSDEFRSQHTAPLSLRFAATERLLLVLDLDAVKSETDEATRERETGVGDTRLGFQFVALKDTEEHPALAFAYSVKLPTASEEKQLGTGRFDHKLTFLLSKKFGENTDLDFNGAFLVNGREGASGWDHGGLGALSVSREFENDWGVEGELAGTSLDDVLPRGLYALGAVTRKVGKRARLDWGARFGLNPAAPRVGLFGGVTFGAGGYKKQ
jgi:hypothetical protein